MNDKLITLLVALQRDVDMMLARPAPKDGRSPDITTVVKMAAELIPAPKDGVSPDPHHVAALVAQQIPTPKDGVSPDPQLVAQLAAQLVRVPEDGKSPDPHHVAKLAAQLIPTPKDGVSPTPQDVAAAMPTPEPGPRGPRGPNVKGDKGDPGKDGASITALDIKDNVLFAAIDGKRKKVGALKFNAPATFDGGGGGINSSTKPRLDALGWDGNYTPNKLVPARTAVYDDGWTMVSNKQTEERAAPQPTGPEKYAFNGILAPDSATAKQVIFGLRFTVAEAGYLLGYRIDVVAGNSYRVFGVEDPTGPTPIINELLSFTAETTGWVNFNVASALLLPGASFDLLAVVNEPDPTPTVFSGSWDYLKPGGNGGVTQPPLLGEITQPTNAPDIMRVSKTDDLGGDRSAELATLTVGDIIASQGVRWSVQSIEDDGGYYSYTVSPAAQAQDQGAQTFDFETVAATPITFGRDAGYWDTVGLSNVRGILAIDDEYANAQVLPDAFGADIKYQAASISSDWDLMAPASGSAGSGGAGASSGQRVDKVTIGGFDTVVAQSPTGLGAANGIVINYGAGGTTTGSEFTVDGAGNIVATDPNGEQFNIKVGLRIGRAGGAGVATPMIRLMYASDGVLANAVQVGGTFGVEVDDADTTWREVFDVDFSPAQGGLLYVEMARDPSGNDSGGLQAPQPTGDMSGWSPIAVARLEIKKRVIS